MNELIENCVVKMPGKSYRGKLPVLSEADALIRSNTERHVYILASEIGDRNYKKPEKLKAAADYIGSSLAELGLEEIRHQFEFQGQQFENIEAELLGAGDKEKLLIVGAHYDSADCPGANDNGSGVAAMIELARILKETRHNKTIRFVAFTNEEHFFESQGMGSQFYAQRCKDRNEQVVGMFSLETIGYYSDERGSQKFPEGLQQFYPEKGSFIGFVGNLDSLDLLNDSIGSFRANAKFPSEGLAAPSWFPGVSLSDHSQFWKQGYPAIMVTDTAPYRYPYYHEAGDTPDKIDFNKMALVVSGLARVVADLAS